MADLSQNNSRIAKNTLLLYFRMFFMMAVAFFTSRVVLSTLGVEDYGILNVVGGVVSMFGFLNAAMSSSTQRYLTFELGQGNMAKLRQVFSTAVQIHLLIALCVLLLAETVGLWLLYEKMVIPALRMDSAWWVYQCSVLSTVVMVASVPYNAMIIAHEKMDAFAYISVLEVVLKLLIVYLLVIGDTDKLKLYAVLMLGVQLLILFVYRIYCIRHFAQARAGFQFERPLFREMLGFAGWNLWGNCAYVLFTQGVNLLLNVFFGPAVNAARAVAVQVQGAIQQFAGNFQTALNPQITKTYAQGEFVEMHRLIFRGSRFTFLLLYVLSLPVMLETPLLLGIWLKLVPAHTVSFLHLILITVMLDSMAQPIMQAAAATGRVRRYQSVVGGILLAIVPVSYVVLKLGGSPESVFIVHLGVCAIAFLVRLFIVRSMIRLSVRSFLSNVLFRAGGVVLASLPLPLLIQHFLPDTLGGAAAVMAVSVACVALAGWGIGMDTEERRFINLKVRTFLQKF